MILAGLPSSSAAVMAASASRKGTSFQPSANTSIFNLASTLTTSPATNASLSISVMSDPTGGFGSAGLTSLALAAFQSSWNLSYGRKTPRPCFSNTPCNLS